jgi:hypothetical protein
MKTTLLGIAVGVVLSASVGLVNAQPVAMTDVQLDKVTAGSFGQVGASGEGVFFNVSGFISASNTSATVGVASASISATDITVQGVPPNTASLSAFASAP